MKSTRQHQNGRTKRVLLFSLMSIGFCIINLLIVSAPVAGGIYAVKGKSWEEESDAGIATEAETLAGLANGRPPLRPDGLVYTLPDLNIFCNDAWLDAHLLTLQDDGKGPDASGQYYAQESHAEAAAGEMLGHAIHEISRCREFVNFNTLPLGEWNEKALQDLTIRYAQHLEPSLSHPYLKHRFICTMSSFWGKEAYQDNGRRLRFRLAISYTDLELLTFLFQNDAPDHANFGVKGAAQPTPSMYAAYRLCLKVVEKARLQVDKQTGHDAPEAERRYAMARLLHDYLCNNCEYSGMAAAENNRFMLTRAILSKTASSEGYARAYRLLLTMASIPNLYVYGEIRYTDASGNPKSAPRCWNLVSTDDQTWFPVDVAGDDPLPGAKATFSHAYFGMPSTLFGKSHKVGFVSHPLGKLEGTPITYTDSAWYFGKEEAAVTSVEEIAGRIVTRAGQGILAGEFLYHGDAITAVALDKAVRLYMESKQFRYDTTFRLDMDVQTLSENMHIVRVALSPEFN